MAILHKHFESPVGRLRLVVEAGSLVAVLWPVERPGRVELFASVESNEDPVLLATERQLDEYFAGQRRSFELPLAPKGTSFQLAVWDALRQIPYGETRSYQDIATTIGNPAAVRAVGAANGKNPLSIIVPCHRVIGSGGQLTGFAGGIDEKRKLLNLEAENATAGLLL